jgi:eukaryotic-like serine/threonine-protein kinase
MPTATRSLSQRYELRAKLGEGGMGVVWRAHDQNLKRYVAIKLLHPLIANVPEQRSRFDREARALAQLTHENIVRVYDYTESGDDAYLVMELIEGDNLGSAVSDRLPISWDGARSYAIPVCRALAYAHARGVIHRDLTPANILVESTSGRVVVSDFGLARVACGTSGVTATGVLIGTPEFWSPEQAGGIDNDSGTDMYALGCILFWLLSGRLPFEGEDRFAAGLRRAHEDAPSLAAVNPTLPEEATKTVDQLLRRNKDQRPTADQVIECLLPGAAGAGPTIWNEPSAHRQPATPVLLTESGRPAAGTPVLKPKPSDDDSRVARRRWRRTAVLALIAALIAAGSAIAVFRAISQRSAPSVSMPRLVGLPLGTALKRLRTLANASSIAGYPATRIARAYSEGSPSGIIVRQRPSPSVRLSTFDVPFAFTVSKGSATAAVPAISAGADPDDAASTLNAAGFATWHRFTPSWNVRKGRVVSLRPGTGTKVHRPARVTILISSGYPKSVVPSVRGLTLTSAEGVLSERHLRYAVVYVPARMIAEDTVISQSPPPDSVMVHGHSVRLNVARAARWRRVFSAFGSDAYRSPPFTVGETWRIRYRCEITNGYADVLTDFSWTRSGDFGSGSFTASTAGALHTYYPSDGAGTFQLEVRPYGPDTLWYFEIDTIE